MPDKNYWPFIVVALVVGLLVGFALTTVAYRHRWMRVPNRGILNRMTDALDLTPAQREEIGEVMQDTRASVMEQRRHFQVQRKLALWGAFDKIRALLTPSQQAIFDREFVPRAARRHYGHHHHHHPPFFPLVPPPPGAAPATPQAPAVPN